MKHVHVSFWINSHDGFVRLALIVLFLAFYTVWYIVGIRELNRLTMLSSFLTITLRVLWRNKVTSLVNIFSLSLGITAFILIVFYVHHETSYDKFNANHDRIYRLEADDYGKLPPVIGTYLKERLPEVENVARLTSGRKDFVSCIRDNDPQSLKHIEVAYFWADSTTFDVFTFPFIKGNPHAALKEPFTVVLTASTAEKLFGHTNPMMKSIEFNNHQFIVTGIIKDVKYSHLEIDVLFSAESISKLHSLDETGWSPSLWSAIYLIMRIDHDKDFVEKKVNDILMEINDGILFDIEFKHFRIRPLNEVYFHGFTQNLQYGLHGNEKLIRVLSAIGVFLLVLASVNYINLTTARSAIRAKEVAIKRIAGSSLTLLRYQFLLESVVVSVIALVFAMTIVQIFLPTFNIMTGVNITVNPPDAAVVWAAIASGIALLGLVAGVYPAIYSTTGSPLGLMKDERMKGTGQSGARKILMVFQFAVSVIMIIAITVNIRQMHFVRNADLGFTKDQVITVHTPGGFPGEFSLREVFKERLLQHSEITNLTFSAGNPGGGPPIGTIEFEGVKRNIGFFFVDDAYVDVMEIKIVDGRSFSSDRPGDRVQNENWSSKENDRVSVLMNETAAKEFGITSPLGKILRWTDREGRLYEVEIIGIVRDFHFRSFHHKVEPLFLYWTAPMELASIRINSQDIPATLKILEKEWYNVYGWKPFRYQFLDETFDRQYKSDEQLATVIQYFTALAILIACLGLFALSSFMVSRRTKEIGVRKSLGASAKSIYLMLSWDFLKWILLAVVIASPVALYVVNAWLSGFAYHIKVGPDVFIIATAVTLGIALITVTGQSLKAAYANPVKALRYE